MRTNELSGAALDWAVAKCEGVTILPKKRGGCYVTLDRGETILLRYSTDWALAGPIIEREKIAINYSNKRSCWFAENYEETKAEPGETPLIAAMRCYVASKLGDNVELPEELK